jgi:positive regulator of sigma E activity
MTKQKRTKKSPRTRATLSRTSERIFETDGTYFLKLVVFALLGTLWLKFQQPILFFGFPIHGIPVGMLLGLIFVRQFEKMQSDRKIWYAILLVVTIVCYFVPAGIVI